MAIPFQQKLETVMRLRSLNNQGIRIFQQESRHGRGIRITTGNSYLSLYTGELLDLGGGWQCVSRLPHSQLIQLKFLLVDSAFLISNDLRKLIDQFDILSRAILAEAIIKKLSEFIRRSYDRYIKRDGSAIAGNQDLFERILTAERQGLDPKPWLQDIYNQAEELRRVLDRYTV